VRRASGLYQCIDGESVAWLERRERREAKKKGNGNVESSKRRLTQLWAA